MWKHQVWVLGAWPQVPTHLQSRPGDRSSTLGRHLAHTVGVKERQSSQSCGQVASGGELRLGEDKSPPVTERSQGICTPSPPQGLKPQRQRGLCVLKQRPEQSPTPRDGHHSPCGCS